ncbi:hypothetical protein [Gemmobacter caeruleus]|uniref:hypothetical protein n=1 Tax=Gemmobacter caeruleus TaxID=2595004 RepID=UPI0011EBB729|nr:hypothetical protein [Gemmobacter caeruleus]
MIGASKILTVSYGTFSCTLEGFDDPFNTMKAIAEYFRDLAAEDRYFGAEPPTPDAAMLHRIAEREIQRRVEAKIQENGVILRAADIPAVESRDAAPVPAPAPAAPVAEVALPEAPAPAAPVSAQDQSVAEKLSRIRSAVARSQTSTITPAAAVPPAPAFESAAFDYVEDADDVAPLPAPAALSDFAEDDLAVDLAEEDFTAEPEAAFDSADDGAMLAHLAAAEATYGGLAPEPAETLPADLIEDLPEDLVEDFAEEVAEHFADELAHATPDDLAASFAEPEVTFDDEDDLSGLLSTLAAETAAKAEEAAAAPMPAEEGFDAEDLTEDMAEDMADVTFRFDDAEPTAAAEVEATLPEAEVEAEPVAEAPAQPVRPEAQERLERARARVIRIRRAPAPEAETAELAGDTPAAPALTPEAEADLIRELAEVQAEAKLAPPAEGAAARPVRPTRPVRPVRPNRPVTPPSAADTNDAAVSRLLEETNSQLAGPENRRRLAAIQHLKAAVAATVAERRAGAAKPVSEAERLDPYREDLSQIVHPKADAPAPASPRPTPLVLVSEQRVDRSAAASVTPIRPQRVAAATAVAAAFDPQDLEEDEDDLVAGEAEDDSADEDENMFSDSGDFSEFAERLGAQGLPALLEAAAAYAACVEGRPHFSRPQIMRQIAALQETTGSSREDSLRSFGTLLRDGRIVKVRRGQYALSEGSHVLAEARKIVG